MKVQLGSGPLLDLSFRSLECDLMLNAPPDITDQSMQLKSANFVLQRHPVLRREQYPGTESRELTLRTLPQHLFGRVRRHLSNLR